MRQTWLMFLLLPVLGGAWAGCSDRGDDDDDVGGDGDADADADGDADEVYGNEAEPNSQNRPADITVPATITGRIGAPAAGAPDVDVFRFTATAGTVVRFTLSGVDRLQPIVALISAPDTTPAITRTMTQDTAGLTRQAFIPVDGDYDLLVADVRNDGSGAFQGGAGFEYQVDIVTETVEPEPTTLPIDVENEDLPTDNGIRIYELTFAEAGFFIADVDAIIGHDPATDFDSALVLMDEALTGLIAENDDQDAGQGNFDALLRRLVDAGTTVNLVVDFWGSGADNSHHLGVQVADLGAEVEPDDNLGTAWPLTVTAGGDPLSPVTGTVGDPIVNPDDSETPDFDYYDAGDRTEGDAIEVFVTATEGSELEPQVFVGALITTTQGQQFTVDWSSQPGADNVARIEATAVQSGRYFVIVTDRRNIVPPDAEPDFELEPVGGDAFGYSLTTADWTRTVTPITLPYADAAGSLSRTGEVDWFELSAAGGGDVLIIDTTTAGWDATISLFDHTPFTPDGGDEIDPIVGFYAGFDEGVVILPYIADDMDLALAVWNAGPWAGPSAEYEISVDARAPDSSTPEEADFGDDTHNAVLAEGMISDFTAQLTQDDESVDADVFMVTLAEGQTLMASAYATDEDATTDPTMALSGGDLDDPIENDDLAPGLLYSRITYTVPAGGAGIYYVTMEPFCNGAQCAVGEYGLRLIIVD